MTNSPFIQSLTADTDLRPVVTHEDITCRARELWIEQGCPENCDEAIWLEAEAELVAMQQHRYRHPHLPITAPSKPQPRKDCRYA